MAGFDLPLCAAGLHPDADLEELNLASQWLTWGTYGDDYYPAVYGAARDLTGARVSNARFAAFMPLEGTPTAVPLTPLERGLADLWTRTAGPMPAPVRRAFHTTLTDMLSSWIWEVDNLAENRVPDPVDYLEMRRFTFGADFTMSLCRLRRFGQVPKEVFHSGPVRSLENAIVDYACLINDVFSYQKEMQFEGELHNGLLVVRNFFGCDYPQALEIVDDLMNSRMRQFHHVVEKELPVLYADLGLDEQARQGMEGYLRDLRNWVAGILNWHRNIRRYREEDLVAAHTPPTPSDVASELTGVTVLPGPPPAPRRPGVVAAG
jgi:germacradienol/geosmin synthase